MELAVPSDATECLSMPNSIQPIRSMPREQLEEFAIRAAIRIRMDRSERSASDYFTAIMTGFSLGAVVAGLGFLAGASFN